MRSKRAAGTGAAVAVAHPLMSAATEAGRGCTRMGGDVFFTGLWAAILGPPVFFDVLVDVFFFLLMFFSFCYFLLLCLINSPSRCVLCKKIID